MSDPGARRGSTYQQGGRGPWYAAIPYSHPITSQRQKLVVGHATEAEAEAALEGWQSLSDRQIAAIHQARREKRAADTGIAAPTAITTVRELMAIWLDEKDPRLDRGAAGGHTFTEALIAADTWDDYEAQVRMWILPNLGSVRLAALEDADTATRFMEQFERTVWNARTESGAYLSWYRARSVWRRLHQAFTYGVKRGHLRRHPMVGRKVPSRVVRGAGRTAERPVTKLALTPAEVATFLGHVTETNPHDPTWPARWRFAFEVGARQAEALGLTWDRLDLDVGEVFIGQQLDEVKWTHGCGDPDADGVHPCAVAWWESGMDRSKVRPAKYCPEKRGGGYVIVTETKWGSDRHVRMRQQLVDELGALRDWQREHVAPLDVDPRELALLRAESSYPIEVADLVFRRPAPLVQRGRQSRATHIAPGHDNAYWHRVLSATGINSTGRTVHAARHTAASALVRAGTPLMVVMEMMGHTTIATTQRYVTTTGVEQAGAMDLLDAYYAREVVVDGAARPEDHARTRG